jgi:hypothetical protein
MKFKSMVAQQQKAIEVLTAQLKRKGGANPKKDAHSSPQRESVQADAK